jgi:hypothetical protein
MGYGTMFAFGVLLLGAEEFRVYLFSVLMKSHYYDIDWRKTVGDFLSIAFAIATFAVVARVWLITHPNARAAVEPIPVPLILAHQWEAAGSIPSEILLIGDSSCLMDVDAVLLEELLSKKKNRSVSVLNLGVVSFSKMDDFGKLVDRAIVANPGGLKRIVLLVHPEMLRRRDKPVNLSPDNFYEPLKQTDLSALGSIHFWLGLDTFERVVLRRCLPSPLPNQWGSFYGFHTGLQRYLQEHKGSAVEYTNYKQGKRVSRFLAETSVLNEARALRERLPKGIPLAIGLMPTTGSFCGPEFPAEFTVMRQRWAEVMQPDVVLTNLPMSLPDSFFATHTHLTREGQRVFTRWLSEELDSILQ